MAPVKIQSKIQCPLCQHVFVFNHSADKQKSKCACPKCKKVLEAHFDPADPTLCRKVVEIKESETQYVDPVSNDGPKEPEPPYEQGSMWLLRKKRFMGVEKYALKKGSNFAGRSENDDIQVNDKTASRHSVDVEVYYLSPIGYACRMKVIKATNPVMINGRAIPEGETRDLHAGDTITLGSTTFEYMKQ